MIVPNKNASASDDILSAQASQVIGPTITNMKTIVQAKIPFVAPRVMPVWASSWRRANSVFAVAFAAISSEILARASCSCGKAANRSHGVYGKDSIVSSVESSWG